MRYTDYLKLYITTCTPTFSVMIVVYGSMRFLRLINPVYISPGTIIRNFIIPMFILAFWLWQKKCDPL